VRLVRLALQDWRGVAEREIAFGNGVTIVEGPNEAGKTTLVQALRILLNEPDSSKKREIKAVQPVGRDVGSTVEAEIEAGDYHFVYAKTYNKKPQTTLDLQKPKKDQLTGREAHDRVTAMLKETVDTNLWDALLVSQGEKVELTDLQASDSLAKALDEAAGSSKAGAEDSRLIDAAQPEYERYYSLKAGNPRFADLERDCEAARIELEEADRRLREIEEDAQAQERIRGEARRLKASLPELENSVAKHRQAADAIRALEGELRTKEKELETALHLKRAAEERQAARSRLIEAVAQAEKGLQESQATHEPLERQVAELKKELDEARDGVRRQREQVKAARAALELARADAAHLENRAEADALRRRLRELAELTEELDAALDMQKGIRVTAELLEEIRAADQALAIAKSRRDAAATRVTVTAEQALEMEFDGESAPLEAGESRAETVAADMTLRLPGMARIEIAPSESAGGLQDTVEDAQAAADELLKRAGVADLGEAIAARQRRAEAAGEVERLRQRRKALLAGRSEDELARRLAELETAIESRERERASQTPLPESPGAAREAVAAADRAHRQAEADLEAAREGVERLQAEFEEQDGRLRVADSDIAGHKAALENRRAELERQRTENVDDELAAQADKAQAAAQAVESSLATLRGRLEEQSPDTVATLLGNAEAALERAQREHRDADKELAIVTDRLQKGRADGRYDEREAAEREYETLQAELREVRRRAAAAKRLWETLNRHRDAARKLYVQPLKEAIENLGAIVFGPTFEVEIGEDWSIESVTRDGQTLAFEDLSVGTKEQLSILSRLAAAQIVSKQGGVPLIIDDALGFSDPQRLETMGAAIAAAAKRCQVIILTCTPGRFAYIGSARVVNL